jgi:hypothetical protein
MKTEQELNADIMEITLTIQNKYPELTKYIDEMPVTVPNKETPEINHKHLENYYNSLVALVNGYNNNNSEPTL